MGIGKPIAIVRSAGSVLSAAIQTQLEKLGNIEIVSAEEIKERGIIFNQPEPIEYNAPIPLEQSAYFVPPMTRRERRAQKRKEAKG